ncbi:MAG: tail fiber protein [Xanthomonadaceae bacterium]|nr:tail fiber protein [Xanthomonadaceae bacterium]MDP2186355.1 tail fiber protein [Xanthomonadales bacterium]MDZ4117208.1 tail fiber protein [Xanthomonadaceae bacterium]MDZ4378823.1 tail fiber protein [Xanthomonadaceae bacterium]
MSEPFVGEIRMFGGNYAPQDWALCDGSVLSISQNDVLFALIGTTYGGDGQTTFALPDMRGRLPLHQGVGPGLSTRVMGQSFGNENVTLIAAQMPSHSHPVVVSTSNAVASTPTDAVPAGQPGDTLYVTNPTAAASSMNSRVLQSAGNSQPHANTMPFVCVNFIISLTGIFPSQN